MTKTVASVLALGLLGLAGCPDIKPDASEGAVGPIVEFDPSASIIPFPNNLVLNPMTGKVNLPKQCNESLASAATRTGLLNTLDGFGTYQSALQVTFSEEVDPATLDGHVLLYQRARGATPIDPTTATAIPVTLIPGTTTRFSADCSKTTTVANLTIVARGALEQRSTYTVALTKGIKTKSGAELGASFTWSLVRQATAPVTLDDAGNVTENHTPLDPREAEQLEQLHGINLLWKAHKGAADFLDKTQHPRSDILLAWEFNTQSNDALDPTVAGSPAAAIGSAPLTNVQPIGVCTAGGPSACVPAGACDPGETNSLCFMELVLGAGNRTAGAALCAAVGCAQVGAVLTATLSSKSYQRDTPNPIGAGGAPVPGSWSDSARPSVVKTASLDVVMFVPSTTAAPTSGTIVFGHGLGSSKSSAAAIASQFAKAGFSTVAIDFVAHGSRAVQTSNAAAKGCDGTPKPDGETPQCYAPFLSSDLAGTRDNIRQSVLDVQGLVASLKACGTTECGSLKVDPAHISYAGISLGGIIGSTIVANVADFKSAVLNVPGAGWIDVLENTASLPIRCSLVDALVSLGVVQGTVSNPPTYTMGTCTTDAWKAQAGYRQFSAIARWALDPADGANFTRKLAPKRLLIQEVVGDDVVPNIATDRLAALVGLTTPGTADLATSAAPAPSNAILTNPQTNKFVRYPAVAEAAPAPANTFGHPSLLRPSKIGLSTTCTELGCQLGTARLQADAIGFLTANH